MIYCCAVYRISTTTENNDYDENGGNDNHNNTSTNNNNNCLNQKFFNLCNWCSSTTHFSDTRQGK